VLADVLRTDRARLPSLVPDSQATFALRTAVRAPAATWFPRPESLVGLADVASVTRQSSKQALLHRVPLGSQPAVPRRRLRLTSR
jgi:hypothetical protein